MKLWLAASVAVALASMTLFACGDDGQDAGEERTISRDLGLIQKDTLTVGSEIPYPPFEEGEPPEYEGFDIDVINAIADKLELETRIEKVPLSVILAGDRGELDLSISAVRITSSREKRVDFSNPYFIASLSLLARDDSEIGSVSDLGGAIVGVEDGTSGERYASKNTEAAEVRAFSTAAEATAALFNSEVDAVIASGPAAEEAAEKSEGLSVAATFPIREQYGIVLPEGNNALRKAVNAALRELKEDGTLNELSQEYFGVEAPQGIGEATRESR